MKLEKNLILNNYFLNLFGFDNFNQLKEKFKNVNEDYDSNGRSYFVDVLIGLKSNWEKEWEEKLSRYDDAIKKYIERLKHNRMQPEFSLKYFQYLAVLFTEIFLDKYSSDKQGFLDELNAFLEEFNNKNNTEITPFIEEDFKKLAFWMATGSGKTLVMHINYWQSLKYFQNNWDNIILITPNENLSKQHYEELKLSGIPAKLYDGNINNLKTKDEEIFVIDIYKLTKEKKGKGVSVDISYFDGKNLVFIDEGHKGQKSEEQTWKNLREKIGKKGFLFEYSATFGQVIGDNKELLEEYAKAIIFDYSYKYFYVDGYGKDFYIYNIKAEKKDNREFYSEEQQNLLFIATLLSFYEQIEIFEEHREELREYNIEKPLWIFVGSKVTGKGVNSDIIKIIQFLNKVISDENYLKENVEKILSGNSNLINNQGHDIFKEKFEFIRNIGRDYLIENIYQKVFGGKGRLEVIEIKNAGDEIGLKVSTAEKYFGLVNIGDVGTLKKLISESDIEVKQDHFNQSLFFGINGSNSPINILIGSKKFVEGWSSWRVSNMGLINMGKGEGAQIIQLFGRGVRLKGQNYSLKREENFDYKLKILQTLFIFGLNADYMNTFLATIEKEDINNYEEIKIPIQFNNSEKWERKIYTIKTRDDFDFLDFPVKLTIDNEILGSIKLDFRPKITIAHGLNIEAIESNRPVSIPSEYFEIIDWNFIYSEIINYKIAKGMYNLIIDTNAIKNIVKSNEYEIFLNESKEISIINNSLKINSFNGVKKLHEIILLVVINYIDRFYKKEEKRKTLNYLEAKPLTIQNHSHMYPENNEIILKIPKELENDIRDVLNQLEDWSNDLPEVWRNWNSFIVHFDNHLYTPLIVWAENQDKIKSIPIKINEGETNFLKGFKTFLYENRDHFNNVDIFLLRNLSRKGIGFFINSGFYPDFIIWVKHNNKQHLIFIDPKGIDRLNNFNDDKIQLGVSYIKEIEERINNNLLNKGETVVLQLDSFILSVTEYKNIRNKWDNGRFKNIDFENAKTEFERYNIIFQKDPKHIEKIFKKAGILQYFRSNPNETSQA